MDVIVQFCCQFDNPLVFGMSPGNLDIILTFECLEYIRKYDMNVETN